MFLFSRANFNIIAVEGIILIVLFITSDLLVLETTSEYQFFVVLWKLEYLWQLEYLYFVHITFVYMRFTVYSFIG